MFSGRLSVRVKVLMLSIALVSFFIVCMAQALSSPGPTASVSSSTEVGVLQNSYASVVNRVTPAVVTIRSERRVRAPQQFPFFDDPRFREFFGDRSRNAPQDSPEVLQRGIGSGVIVSADGYILTNHHVVEVQPGSAAERAGLKPGDIITALNGTAVDSPNSFRNQVASTEPGSEVELGVLRDNREQQLRVTLGELKGEALASDDSCNGDESPGRNTGKLGISLEPLTYEVISQLRLPPGTQGLLVRDVDTSGPAAEAGIQSGDVIEQVNQRPVRSAADLSAALERSGNRPALLLINRRGTTLFVTVTPRA
jgi:S1-C subfamily serine protease